MKVSIQKLLATTILIVFSPFPFTVQAETSFSFAPAPVAKALLPGEKTNRISGEYVNILATDSENSSEFELDSYGVIYTHRTRSASNRKRGSRSTINAFSASSLSDTSDGIDLYLTGFGTLSDMEFYGNRKGTLIFFTGVGLDYLDMEFDSCFLQCTTTDSSSLTYSLRLGVQNRFALGNNFGVTPFVLAVARNTSFLSDSEADSFTTTSTTFGLDIDFRGVSLTAFYQSQDDTEVTSLSLGVNF